MNAVVDRVVQYPHRYQLKNVNTGEVLGTFDLEPITGTISVVGTKIDKELFDSIANDISARLVSNGGDAKDNVITFNMASSRSNVASGEKLSVSFGKIAKYFSDLKAVAFSGSKADIGLDNVDNTSDANKPVSTAQQQALNNKANSSDVYTKTETDGLLNDKANTNDVYSKTKTDELLNNKANKSDVYTKTETDGLLNNKANASDVYTKSETDAGLNKSLYNLGYYDTMVENSDGTYTITRQTGYFTIEAQNIISTFTSGGSKVFTAETNIILPNAVTDWNQEFGTSNIGYKVISVDGNWIFDKSIGGIGGQTVKIANNDFTTIDQFKALCPIKIQYKMTISYTEKVEKNHYARYNQRFILDHNKSEAERSANLIDIATLSGTTTTQDYFLVTTKDITSILENNGKRNYIVSVKLSNVPSNAISAIEIKRDWQYWKGTQITGNGNLIVSFTYEKGYTYQLVIYGNYKSGNGIEYTYTFSDIMLNEGSVALPYQPYEGKVVHEKDLESITPGIFSLVGNNVDTLTISKNETYFITSVAVNPIYVEGNTGISFIGSSLVTTVGMLSGEPKICLNGSAYTLDNNSVTLKTTGLMKVYKVNY